MDTFLYILLVMAIIAVVYGMLWAISEAFGPPQPIEKSYVHDNDEDFASERDRWPEGGPPR